MTTNVLASLNNALHDVMAENESVFILGEDILDPYGGRLKLPKGYPQNFLNASSQHPYRKPALLVLLLA